MRRAVRVPVRVKVCGVTSVEDAQACADAGADAIGVRLVGPEPWQVDLPTAKRIARAVEGRLLVVGVVAPRDPDRLRELRTEAGFECLQIEGEPGADVLAPLLPHAYAAVTVASAADIARAERQPGEYLLLRADEGFDWTMAAEVAQRRRITLAGGFTPERLAEALRGVAAYCVDVRRGVERAPGVKDRSKLDRLVAAARGL